MRSTATEGNGTNRLVYWILGALVTLVGFVSGIAHQMMMTQLDSIESTTSRQLDSIESRIERLENVRMKGE